MGGSSRFGGPTALSRRGRLDPQVSGRRRRLHWIVRNASEWGRLWTGEGFNELAVQTLKDRADERVAGLAATLDACKAEGIKFANGLAGALNALGHATARGCESAPKQGPTPD